MVKVYAPVLHLLNAMADTETIQAAYFKATGKECTKRAVRGWRAEIGRSFPKGYRHSDEPKDDRDGVLQIQALAKRYMIPTNGSHLLC